MLTEEEKTTIASYNKTAPEWIRAHSNTSQCAREFEIFREYLPNGYVLEIGSAGGRDARRFRAAGYGYIGTDVSSGMLEEARKYNPGITFLFMDIYSLNLPILFDGFWSAATLLHIPKPRLPKALKNINRAIKPDGIGFIGVKEGEGDLILDEEIYGSRYFSYYSESEFTRHLEDSGFSILKFYKLPVSKKTTWLNYFVKVQK